MTLNSEQTKGFNTLKEGVNTFITGDGGTGKSVLINTFIDWAENNGRQVLVTAPTGIAALNVNGATIHRTFKVPFGPIINKPNRAESTVQEADIIIIDEISMCRVDLFDYLSEQIIKTNKKRRANNKNDIQLVVSGDFFQLPPVITPRDREVLEEKYGNNFGRGFAFQSEYWQQFNFKVITLKETIRQTDTEFIYWLNQARIGNVKSLGYFSSKSTRNEIDNAVTLCGTNKAVQEKNIVEMNKIQSKSKQYEAIIEGDVKDSDKATLDTLELKVGARVMTLINDKDDLYYNGSFGTIKEMNKDGVTVMMDEGYTVEIYPYTWDINDYRIHDKKLQKEVVGTFTQLPLKLAYAITIHKSQGQTYEKVNINPYCWDCGQLYVALSRVKNINMMHLTSYLNSRYLVTAAEVREFYNGLNQHTVTNKFL